MLFQSVVLAAVTSVGAASPTQAAPLLGPMWATYVLAIQAPWRVLQLAPQLMAPFSAPCARLKGALPKVCAASVSGPDIDADLPAPVGGDVEMPSVSDELGASLGGFANYDVMDAVHLAAGPELSWLTPDSPREDLLRLRVLTSGWGVRYAWSEIGLSLGVVVGTRFVKMGEVDFPVVDMFTSEARAEIVLP